MAGSSKHETTKSVVLLCKICANSLAVMNTALLRPCHVFMQLSYILATCTHCLHSHLRCVDTLHEAVSEASTDQLSSRKIYSSFVKRFSLSMKAAFDLETAKININPILNTVPFLFAIWPLFQILELIQKRMTTNYTFSRYQ